MATTSSPNAHTHTHTHTQGRPTAPHRHSKYRKATSTVNITKYRHVWHSFRASSRAGYGGGGNLQIFTAMPPLRDTARSRGLEEERCGPRLKCTLSRASSDEEARPCVMLVACGNSVRRANEPGTRPAIVHHARYDGRRAAAAPRSADLGVINVAPTEMDRTDGATSAQPRDKVDGDSPASL